MDDGTVQSRSPNYGFNLRPSLPLPLMSGGVSRPKRDLGWILALVPPLSAPSCEIPLERVGDQSAGHSEVAGTW